MVSLFKLSARIPLFYGECTCAKVIIFSQDFEEKAVQMWSLWKAYCKLFFDDEEDDAILEKMFMVFQKGDIVKYHQIINHQSEWVFGRIVDLNGPVVTVQCNYPHKSVHHVDQNILSL